MTATCRLEVAPRRTQHEAAPASGAAALPQDAALPQLASALNETGMAGVFGDLLRHGSTARIERCRVERVKYRPGRNLAVSYVLDLQDDRGPYTQRVAARFCSAGESARRHAKALARTQQPSRTGLRLSHHAGLDMAAHWWPNDAKLAAGAVLADDDALHHRWLPPVLQAAGHGALDGHRVALAQVVAEHRVTARVDMRTVQGDSVAVYAKADAECRGPVTHAVMHSLWHSEARRSGRLVLPRPLLWQPDSGLHWQMAVPGLALLDAMPARGEGLAAAAGALVAALHTTPAPAAPRLGGVELRQRLQEVLAVLGRVCPEHAGQAGRLAGPLEAGLAHTLAAEACTLHGDLHPRNLLVDGDRLALIDLDSARQGPALLELGAWLADGRYRAALQGHDAQAAARAGQAFLQGYTGAGGARHSPAQLAWATAWQLLCQRAWRCVVNLKPGRFALVPQLLAQCAALLQPNADGEAMA